MSNFKILGKRIEKNLDLEDDFLNEGDNTYTPKKVGEILMDH